MASLYKQKINTNHPGLILILVDQSSSMDSKFGNSTKSIVAANAVNRLIYELRVASQDGDEIHDRCYLGVIGYGPKVGAVVGGRISEFTKLVKTTKKFKEKVGNDIVDIEMPVWVEPLSDNGTPMDEAFNDAYNLASGWISKNLDSFPPVVINISDGEPNDLQRGGDGKKTHEAAKRLMELKTNHGKLLLFNAHIGDSNAGEILLPHVSDVLDDHFAKYLFEISTEIPDPLFEFAQKSGFSPMPKARGLVFNAAAESLIKLLNFGSSQFV